MLRRSRVSALPATKPLQPVGCLWNQQHHACRLQFSIQSHRVVLSISDGYLSFGLMTKEPVLKTTNLLVWLPWCLQRIRHTDKLKPNCR